VCLVLVIIYVHHNRIEWNTIYNGFEPFKTHCAPYSLTFYLGKEKLNPSPTALLKARINLGWVFLIASESSILERRDNYLLCVR
jgi:hypothetical protein